MKQSELHYRLFGAIHKTAKRILRKTGPTGDFYFSNLLDLGVSEQDVVYAWKDFIKASIVPTFSDFSDFHYAGYIAEKKEWCLPSWIWTNSSVVRMCCFIGDFKRATELGELLAEKQQACGGWIVRNDYDKNGAIPVLAPNDSAYIANNAFLKLYEITHERRYLVIARKCADWIIETARPDGLVYTGYNTRDGSWNESGVIVDTGFTAGLFANLAEITGERCYFSFLERFVKRYMELFYLPKKKGFCTSIDNNNKPQGGMFARGQAWALEGLIPAYRVLKDERIKEVIDSTVGTLLKEQLRNGGWSYNITRKLMGEDCKAVSVIAKDMMEWYEITGDVRIKDSAINALGWCRRHTAQKGEAKGGIFSYCSEGGIVKDLYTSCAFVYASAYAIELEKMLVG